MPGGASSASPIERFGQPGQVLVAHGTFAGSGLLGRQQFVKAGKRSGQVCLQGLSGLVAFTGPPAVVLVKESVAEDLAEPGKALLFGAAAELLPVPPRFLEGLLHQIGGFQAELPVAGELCVGEQQQRRAIPVQALVRHEGNLRRTGW